MIDIDVLIAPDWGFPSPAPFVRQFCICGSGGMGRKRKSGGALQIMGLLSIFAELNYSWELWN